VPYGQITQFVVGAAGESDRELLETTGRLYREIHLARAHFSAFRPVADTPLEGQPASSPVRRRRLYQADSLLRQYGFSPEELPLGEDGNLSHDRDPKLEWARRHPERFPVELNRAGREELLRVPGIGPRGAAAILRARRKGRIRSADDLRRLGLRPFRAAAYLLADGRSISRDEPVQLPLWEP
jgi:predicted DNA-binding helix-hairpin-helix protein